MRRLYLARHGKVAFPAGIKRCIGRTDYPLDKEGREQAEHLAEYFRLHPIETIYASPLRRSRETAAVIAGDTYTIKTEDGLTELDMGEWEDIPLSQIRKTLESEPNRGEGRRNGLQRFQKAVAKILRESEGDVLCVAHAGINCCYLSGLMGQPLESSRALPQPYGGFSTIFVDEKMNCRVETVGRMPKDAPFRQECERLWERYHTPEEVRLHSIKVCETALEIGERLLESGISLDLDLIRAGALLHDIARAEEEHPKKGAQWLRKEGYPRVADIILCHHDLPARERPEIPGEAEVIYLADKCVKGTEEVSLEERFEASRRKCMMQKNAGEALKAHGRRYREELGIRQKIEKYCRQQGAVN